MGAWAHEAASAPAAGLRAAVFGSNGAGEGFDGIGRSPGYLGAAAPVSCRTARLPTGTAARCEQERNDVPLPSGSATNGTDATKRSEPGRSSWFCVRRLGNRGNRGDRWGSDVFGGYTESDALWDTAHPERSRYFNLPPVPVSSVSALRQPARSAIPNHGWVPWKRNLARFLSFTIDFQLLHYTLRSFAAPPLAPLQRLRLHDAIPAADGHPARFFGARRIP